MRSRHFVVLWFAIFVAVAGIGMVSPLLPIFAEDLGASGIWLGLTFSGFAITQSVATPFVGKLSDRFGRKAFIVIGFTIYGLAAVGYALSTTYQMVVVIRVLAGVGTAFIFPVSMAYVGDLAPRGREGTFMGTFSIANMAGFGIGPLIGGALRDTVGMDGAFLAMAGLLTMAGLVVLLLLPGRVQAAGRHDLEYHPSTSLGGALRDGYVQAAALTFVIWSLGMGATLGFLAVYVTDAFAASGIMIGVLISSRQLLSGSLQSVFGRLADRRSRMWLVAIGMTGAASLQFLIPEMPTYGAILGLFLFIGLFEALSWPAASAISVDAGRRLGMGAVMGVTQTAQAVGIVAGSLIGGAVADIAGIESVFRYAGVMGLLGVLVFTHTYRAAQRNALRLPAAEQPLAGTLGAGQR